MAARRRPPAPADAPPQQQAEVGATEDGAHGAALVPTRLSSETVGRHDIFDVVRHRMTSSSPTRCIDAICLAMADWVTVVALTDPGDVVLVRQYRYGAAEIMLETPGGIVDPGETPLEAAARELREETGYAADRMESLGWVHPNPAIQDNRLHMVLAPGARCVGGQQLDEHESVEPVVLTARETWQQLRDGQIRNALSALALERAFAQLGYPGKLSPP